MSLGWGLEGALTPGPLGRAAPTARSWTCGLGQPSLALGIFGSHRLPTATALRARSRPSPFPRPLDTAPSSAEDLAVCTPAFPGS